ncbi:hypothetical protein T440DRAFT_405063 [Plenodomus tracheiphilus IPT5]|uniref:Uncharacterized protein n=1 Tax=Plenodomus tracheiphilus IPT5 TaxID=1408161 RepID=A0A6A7AX59_9PLEO|nr:hypothetical protein T440DRAFT_405063 [Plenodomus tracheiphilus IPT5]
MAEVVSVISLFVGIASTVTGTGRSLFFFLEHYRLPGLILYVFGSRGMWRVQTQTLCSPTDDHVMDFKKSVQEDSNIIAVAGTIIAQIAITALSLNDLSRTHWVARAAFTLSLVSATMSVYYATRQYRSLGRCLHPEEVRDWIKGKHRKENSASSSESSKYQDMLPSPASVLTVSAPNMLLSASLHSFLIGLGIYFGYTWTRNLDADAGVHGSRAVFITYLIGLIVCYGIFGLSSLVVAGQSYQSEKSLLHDLQQFMNAARAIRRDDEEGSRRGRDAKRTLLRDITPTPSRGQDVDEAAGLVVPSRRESRPKVQQGSGALDEKDREELVHALRDLVELRKQVADVDERLMRVLTKL